MRCIRGRCRKDSCLGRHCQFPSCNLALNLTPKTKWARNQVIISSVVFLGAPHNMIMQPFGLTDEQRQSFHAEGYVKLRNMVSDSDVTAMVDLIWAHLHRRNGIEKDRPATWSVERPIGFQVLTRADAFAAVANTKVLAALNQLLGEGRWRVPSHWGAPLVAFPTHGDWSVPHDQWHLDFTVGGSPSQLAGIRVLALLSHTSPRGGTTLVLSGSHALITRLRSSHELTVSKSSDVRKCLMRRYDWFHALCSPDTPENLRTDLMERGVDADGIPVRIVALDGQPGDLVLVHPWSFHAPSENHSTHPRIMISESVFTMLR